METITHLRLINKAFIKVPKSPKPRLYYLYKTIALSDKNKIDIKVSSSSAYDMFPYLDGMFVKSNIKIRDFYKYITELAGYLNMYNGTKPYTKLELNVSYQIQNKQDIIENKTQVYVHYNIENDKIEIKTLDYNDQPILLIPNFKQSVITDEQLETGQNHKLIFLKSSCTQA